MSEEESETNNKKFNKNIREKLQLQWAKRSKYLKSLKTIKQTQGNPDIDEVFSVEFI